MILKCLFQCTFAFLVCVSVSTHAGRTPADPSILVKGLFSDRALLEINGKPQFLKVGVRSKEGVLLVSSESLYLEIEYKGTHHLMMIGDGLGGSYTSKAIAPRLSAAQNFVAAVSETKKDTSIRISNAKSGHYLTPGKINGRWVEFMIDTGATKIALNSFTAELLGIEYLNSEITTVDTAQGQSKAYIVKLKQVSIGNLVVNNPEAFIIEGRYPQRVLLGNTFLSHVSVKMEKGEMVLSGTH